MVVKLSEAIRGWLGWCPDNQMAPSRIRYVSPSLQEGDGMQVQQKAPPAEDPSGIGRKPEYEHTQPGYLLAGAVGLFTLFLVAMMVFFGPQPVALVVLCIMVVILAIMSRLTVSVHETSLRIRFGPVGLIHKEWPLKEIVSATPVENPWYYGYGIRFTPHGRLYNVSGRHAVEILLVSGKKVRIGTDEPQVLAEAIRNAVR